MPKLKKNSKANKSKTVSSRIGSKVKKSSRKSQPKDNYLKTQLMVGTARILLKAAAFAANAALYNKEVGRRLNKRSHEALQVVGQLARGIKDDIKEGVKAAKKAQLKNTTFNKKISAGKKAVKKTRSRR